MVYDSQAATALLGISPETLHDWSERFAALLSNTAQPSQPGHANGAQPRYTEHDIALLGQIKALLNDGHTHEQAWAILSNQQANTEPKNSSRRPHHQKTESQAPAPATSRSSEWIAPPATGEQIIASKDQQIAELEEMLQIALHENNQRVLAAKEQQAAEFEPRLRAEQLRSEQFSQQIQQLQAENQALRERLSQAESGHVLSYSFQLKVMLIMVLVAALITILIEYVFKS